MKCDSCVSRVITENENLKKKIESMKADIDPLEKQIKRLQTAELLSKQVYLRSLTQQKNSGLQRNKHQFTSIPRQLKDIPEIKRLEAYQAGYIYFLVNNGEVVYVGQTSDCWPTRINTHIKEEIKKFNDVWYMEVDTSMLNTIENKYIKLLRPRYNRVGVRMRKTLKRATNLLKEG